MLIQQWECCEDSKDPRSQNSKPSHQLIPLLSLRQAQRVPCRSVSHNRLHICFSGSGCLFLLCRSETELMRVRLMSTPFFPLRHPFLQFKHILYNSIIYQFRMTLNCPVNQIGQPLAVPQQQFILYRPNVQFQVAIDGVGKKKAKGTGYLTSYRIIFVSQKPDEQFYSFDIPIRNLFGEKVEFPIFGCTYLQGSSAPYQNLLPGNSHFKLYFKQGSCDTFIKILSELIKQTRSSMQKQQTFEQSQFYHDVRSGKFNFNALVNPNDPSKLYTQQPQ